MPVALVPHARLAPRYKGLESKAMSNHNNPTEPSQSQLQEVQAALFSLRDGLMNLKMSLQELAFMTDENAQREAMLEAENLMMRLRG